MELLITNQNINLKFSNAELHVINFNPWGFSKSGIRDQLLTAVKDELSKDIFRIGFYVTPLFFGARGKIAVNYLKILFPKSIVHVLTSSGEVELFLNNPSV